MNRLLCTSSALITVAIASAVPIASAAEPEPKYRLRLTVKDDAGNPLPGVYAGVYPARYVGDFTVFSQFGDRVSSCTTDQGFIDFLAPSGTIEWLDYGLVIPFYPQLRGMPEDDQRRAGLIHLLERWAFPRRLRVPKPPTDADINADLMGARGRGAVVKVTRGGTAISSKDVVVVSGDRFLFSDVVTGDPNTVRIVGLNRYQPTLMVLNGSGAARVMEVPALAAPAAGQPIPETVPDLDMGDVEVGALTAGVPVTATFAESPSTDINKDQVFSRSAASFVRDDGTVIFSWRRFGATNIAGPAMQLVGESEGAPDHVTRLPAGTYYIVPGYWACSDRQWQFLKLLRAHALPANHGVPTITITEGQTAASVTITPEPIDAALKALLSTPVPPANP